MSSSSLKCKAFHAKHKKTRLFHVCEVHVLAWKLKVKKKIVFSQAKLVRLEKQWKIHRTKMKITCGCFSVTTVLLPEELIWEASLLVLWFFFLNACIFHFCASIFGNGGKSQEVVAA